MNFFVNQYLVTKNSSRESIISLDIVEKTLHIVVYCVKTQYKKGIEILQKGIDIFYKLCYNIYDRSGNGE